MTLNYLGIIGGERNIFVHDYLTVNIGDTESERTLAHFIRFKIIIAAAFYLLKFTVFVKVFQLCYRIAVVTHLNSAPEFRASLLVFV